MLAARPTDLVRLVTIGRSFGCSDLYQSASALRKQARIGNRPLINAPSDAGLVLVVTLSDLASLLPWACLCASALHPAP